MCFEAVDAAFNSYLRQCSKLLVDEDKPTACFPDGIWAHPACVYVCVRVRRYVTSKRFSLRHYRHESNLRPLKSDALLLQKLLPPLNFEKSAASMRMGNSSVPRAASMTAAAEFRAFSGRTTPGLTLCVMRERFESVIV